MTEKEVVIRLDTGLHARPAARFVQEANKFAAEIFVSKDGKKVNAKSIMGIMSLAVAKGAAMTIIADGTDEEEAVRRLENLISRESLK
ncbi:HPr family phosphocarrier protein [Mechercharimyces sp. CAU 1602]|uniref:HPr family phosphocarrier protein n=1 Tax=Mechercharimyces sp. CAU 1602 TaxID=2973933 RepID=UPI002163D7D8|nr:HPr family phosphocarrier protein [Mechercharimyces sp. CAU 1602]MCS1352198.1 HPr family phosphocarrier protein [Mechercharimyces sp. CAU 1602]